MIDQRAEILRIKSDANFKCAELAFEENGFGNANYDVAVSRYYYACFQLAKAIFIENPPQTMYKNSDPEAPYSHKNFILEFKNRFSASDENADLLAELKADREAADYTGIFITKDIAKERRERVIQFRKQWKNNKPPH